MAPDTHPLRPVAPHPLRRSMEGRIARTVVVADSDSDLKLFAVSFTAFFVCFYTFFL